MPVTQIRAFHRPEHLQQAWHLLQEGPQVRLVGGGTDLAISCPPEVRVLVDLAHIGIDEIGAGADGSISIGAMATLTDVLEHDGVNAVGSGVIGEMLVHVGSPLLRNAATIGGHLARGFLSDVIPVLLALDAQVEVFRGQPVTMSLADYYATGANREPHVLTRVILPKPTAGSAAAFLRFSRSTYDHAMVNVACRVDVDGGTVIDARVVLGAGAGVAERLPVSEQALVGGSFDDAAIEAAARAAVAVPARTNWVASADYRSHLAVTLTGRCLVAARERLGGAA